MGVKQEILTIGFDKNGQSDFGVCMVVVDLSFEQMKEIRAMIPVAIGQMERIWYDAQMRKPENQTCGVK